MKKNNFIILHGNHLLLFVLLFFLFSDFLFWINIFYGSYQSYVLSCKTPFEEVIENNLSAGYFNPDTQEIVINYECGTEEYDETFKHENIHYFQYINDYSYNCDEPIKHYLNEVEAYFGESIPNFIYKKMY